MQLLVVTDRAEEPTSGTLVGSHPTNVPFIGCYQGTGPVRSKNPPPAPGRIRSAVRPSVLRLMDRFTDLPVLLLDAKTEVLAWNPMAGALLGDLSAVPVPMRNVARQAFLGSSRVDVGPEGRERLDRALVSDLRRSAARYPDDPGLTRLVADLCAGSEQFARLWTLRELDERHGDRKRIRHPELGLLELDCNVLHIQGDDQTLLVYSAAPGTREAEALALLSVVGLQQVGGDADPATEQQAQRVAGRAAEQTAGHRPV